MICCEHGLACILRQGVRPDSEDHWWGDAVYDVSGTFNAKVHRLREHPGRLYRSVTFASIDFGMTGRQIG